MAEIDKSLPNEVRPRTPEEELQGEESLEVMTPGGVEVSETGVVENEDGSVDIN